MIALKILGVICIILVCFGAPISLIIESYKKPKPEKIDEHGNRELKINQISYWEYLIIILPACLLLIGLLTNNRQEKLISFTILGLGYAILLISSYNNRIDIPWVNRTTLITCLSLSVIYYLLSLTNYNYKLRSGLSYLKTLLLPMLTYIYLFVARKIIKLITNTYPITSDRVYPIGSFSNRFNRRVTYWDLVWTFGNWIVLVAIGYLINT